MNTTPEPIGAATYSPDDNKLRLYPFERTDSETYARLKEHGFSWAPVQKLFVAAKWTPARADLLFELCGDIDDDDMSLFDRAEARAERAENFATARAQQAAAARDAVSAFTEHMPLGQPILRGHHSERRARKDAERIENGMRRAVRLWETSQYWTRRAAAALSQAKYREVPAVRYRRIKGIETEKRGLLRDIEEARVRADLWSNPSLTLEKAVKIANVMPGLWFAVPGIPGTRGSAYWMLNEGHATPEYIAAEVQRSSAAAIAHAQRWIEHCDNRLAYENAMLGESGGLKADAFDLAVGGKVLSHGEWLTILKINRSRGKITSVTTTPPSGWTWQQNGSVSYENIRDYREPTAESIAAAKTPPLVNFRMPDGVEMTKDEYKKIHTDYKSTRKAASTEEHGAYRYRVTMRQHRLVPVFLTDAKEAGPPAPTGVPSPVSEPGPVAARKPDGPQQPDEAARQTRQLQDILRNGGVQTVVADQLFPTPAALAARMTKLAELQNGMTVLEPSAGTGSLLDAIRETGLDVQRTAVEINSGLARQLSARHGARVVCADFLATNTETLGTFDRVLMNPPFADAADIAHIRHAYTMLNPGGVLVAVCAAGSRQQQQLRGLAQQTGGTWNELPDGTFKDEGTGVRTALLTLRKGHNR